MTEECTEPDWLAALRERRTAAWLRPSIADADAVSDVVPRSEVEAANQRFIRFAPILAHLFPENGWDGRILSPIIDFPTRGVASPWLVKADHALPMTGSIKARGGVHALLCVVERLADDAGIAIDMLVDAEKRAMFSDYTVVVASTGNLGYSIGLVARAFGFSAEIHMSSDAKLWKKTRLIELGASLVEHDCDYSETIVRARLAARDRPNTIFIDDETSRDLLTGYAVAAYEVIEQLKQRAITIGEERQLVAYLPCGVGGAPGGITHGLKHHFGANVVIVFVEPIASPCMLVALASGVQPAPSVYDYGCDNETIADGLAVPRASELVLAAVGKAIDAVIAVPDDAMVEWVRTAWQEAMLKLEPSAAAAFAAHNTFMCTTRAQKGWPDLANAVHLFWATGGSKVPEPDFLALLGDET